MKTMRTVLWSLFALSSVAAFSGRAAEASGAAPQSSRQQFCATRCEQVERNCLANGGDPATCDAAFNSCQDACLSAAR